MKLHPSNSTKVVSISLNTLLLLLTFYRMSKKVWVHFKELLYFVFGMSGIFPFICMLETLRKIPSETLATCTYFNFWKFFSKFSRDMVGRFIKFWGNSKASIIWKKGKNIWHHKQSHNCSYILDTLYKSYILHDTIEKVSSKNIFVTITTRLTHF